MTKQTVNIEVTKPEHEPKIVSETESEKRIDQIAEEVAEKGAHTEQNYDKEHQIFSK